MKLVQTRYKNAFIIYVVFFKIARFLWIILILNPGHTSLFLESVTIKFLEPTVEDPHVELRAEAQEKQIPSLNTMILLEKEK